MSSENYVSFSIAEFGDAVDGTTYTYDVSVGSIDFRRVYRSLEGGGVEPIESMLVRGVDVSQLETDDSIFNTLIRKESSWNQTSRAEPAASVKPAAPAVSVIVPGNDQPTSSSSTLAQPNAEILERPVTIAAPLISDLPEPAFDRSKDATTEELETVAESLVGGGLSSGFETVNKVNIAISGESNYENLLADKTNIAEEILIFGDDSYVLGPRNKQILGEMMGKFNPDTDVVSVVGCSTGVTKIANGNAALAIGRANRVKEALLYSGVPHDKIFEEGCWSPNANSTPFPNRGVVVTVKRSTS